MQVASLELCQEVSELLGWKDTDYVYYKSPFGDRGVYHVGSVGIVRAQGGRVICEAYDLGYLLDKLPVYGLVNNGLMCSASHYDSENDRDWYGEDKRAVDAVARLCITLAREKEQYA